MPFGRLGNSNKYRGEKRQNNNEPPPGFRRHTRKQKPAQNSAQVRTDDAQSLEDVDTEILGKPKVRVCCGTRVQVGKQVMKRDALGEPIENDKYQRRERRHVKDAF